MRVPVLKQGRYLIASVQSSLDDQDWETLKKELNEKVGQYRSTGVIIDVTIVDLIDSFAARSLRNISQVLRIRGARTMVVGIQPEVGFSMIQLGLRLDGVQTALDLDDGMRLLEEQRRGGEPNA